MASASSGSGGGTLGHPWSPGRHRYPERFDVWHPEAPHRRRRPRALELLRRRPPAPRSPMLVLLLDAVMMLLLDAVMMLVLLRLLPQVAAVRCTAFGLGYKLLWTTIP